MAHSGNLVYRGDNTRMTLSAETLVDYQSLSSREWLCTNGSGAFASGTVANVPTCRYHVLLTVPMLPRPSGV